MAVGDVIQRKRVRWSSNQRIDDVDADALSKQLGEHSDALMRAVLSTPNASGGATPPGVILTGFGLTLNPTGGTDGKIRIASALGVAIDSDGRYIVKDSGTVVDVPIPSGTYQVYIYCDEVKTDEAQRRFLSVTSPFVEAPRPTHTSFVTTYGAHVRSGNATNFVASDNVLGKTRALCAIAVATNTGGTITITGWNGTTAPNGSAIVNRLTSVVQPSSPPTLNTVSGGVKTIAELAQTLAYFVGQAAWKGSDFLSPAAGNNFGAFREPAGGADKAFRQALGYITIGNGTTIFGDFNTIDYANANAMMVAALASLPAGGGVIHLKRGIALSGFNSATLALPADKTVTLRGEHAEYPSNTPQITFAAGEGFVMNATGKFIVENLHVRHVAPVILINAVGPTIRNVYFENTSTTDQGAAIQTSGSASACADLDIDGMHLTTVFASALSTACGVRTSDTVITSRARIQNVRMETSAFEAGIISLGDIGSDIDIGFVSFKANTAQSVITNGTGMVKINASDNTTNIANRYVHDLYMEGAGISSNSMALLNISNVGHLVVARLMQLGCRYGIYGGGAYSGTGPVTVRDCNFNSGAFSIGGWTSTIPDLTVINCFINVRLGLGDAACDIGKVIFSRCTFRKLSNYVQGTTAKTLIIEDCELGSVGSTSSADIHIIQLRVNTLQTVVINNNVVANFNNVSYAGADANTSPRVFQIDSNSWQTVRCTNNTATDIQNASSGNARAGSYLLNIDAEDRTSNAGVGYSLIVSGNQLGGPQSTMGLLLASRFTGILNAQIANNNISAAWSTDTTLPKFNSLIMFETTNGTVTQLALHGNNFFITPNNTANISKDLFWLRSTGGTPLCASLSFQDNHIHLTNMSVAWDFSGGYGFYTGGIAIVNLIVRNNTASRGSSTASTEFFRIACAVTPTRTLPTGGKPAVSVAWSDNNLIYSNG